LDGRNLKSMDATGATTRHQPSRWDPLFAAGYDTMLRLGERLGMRAQRRRLLARAQGRTLEIGGGTGLNIPLYPEGLEDLILAEPYEPMRRRLERRLASSGRSARTIDAAAESIPLPDGSLDTVVSTLVLCTVDDPARALAEIARVLSPGGQLLFIEHVRSHSPRVARWQDRFEAPWRHLAAGCRCNRDTLAQLGRSGFHHEHEDIRWRGLPPIVAPVIIGRAWLASS
jgi:ubiquinone/menaquinone biosynthesis C-methylase UbiE